VSAQVSGGWENYQKGRQLTISLGSLISDRPQAVYLKLDFKAGHHRRWLVAAGLPSPARTGKADPCKAGASLPLHAGQRQGEQKAQADPAPCWERFAKVEMADAANEALAPRTGRRPPRAANYLYQRSQDYDSAHAGRL